MTGKDILEEGFEKAGMRGYRADQVDDFLQAIATYVDEINEKNDDLTYKLQILADKIEEYKKDEENIRDALLGAQKLGSSILNEAKAKAESITRESKSSTEELLRQAKSKVDLLTKDSLQKANSEIIAIKKEVAREQRVLDSMKLEVSNFRSSILKQYKVHLDLLSNLPTVEQQPITFGGNAKQKESPVQTELSFKEEAPNEDDDSNNQSETISSEMSPELEESIIDSDIENEDMMHTREFDRHKKSNTTPLELNDEEKEKVKNEFNSRIKRTTNYAEKYGELAFGSNNEK